MKYKYIGNETRLFPTLAKEFNTGDEFESDVEISSPYVEKVETIADTIQTDKKRSDK